ncbi:MAG: PspC domain-containing protein [Flavobacteriales bacterium]|nr:PspC domain-containing protein [Flavobacteriales bacterium]
MKKTVTINLSGIVFTLDEDAYESLQIYLNSIRKGFSNSEGCDEILADIEARIAELFKEMLEGATQVISMKELDQVIEVMGKVEDFIDDDSEETENSQEHTNEEQGEKQAYSRLYRDGEKRILAGICSGLSYRLQIDPIWLRILFVVFAGFFIPVYVILWIVIPEAKTTSEKLEMKGEPINIGSIGKTIEDSLNDITDRINKETAGMKGPNNPARKLLIRIIELITALVSVVFRFVTTIVGFTFSIVGFTLLATIIIIVFANGISSVWMPIADVDFPNQTQLLTMLFGNEMDLFLGKVGLGLLIGIPALALLYVGIKLIFKIKQSFIGLGLGLTCLWIVGLLLTIFTGATFIQEFRMEDEVVNVTSLDTATTDTLRISLNNDLFKHGDHQFRIGHGPGHFRIKLDEEHVYLGNPRLSIEKASGDQFEVHLYKKSRGTTTDEANNLAQQIKYLYQVSLDEITFDSHYEIQTNSKWRVQEVHVVLSIPEGKAVKLDDKILRILKWTDNASDSWPVDMVGKTWTMTSNNGLTCIGCDKDDL